MLDEARKLYQSVSTNHRNAYIMADAIEKMAPKLAGDLKETADMTYALGEAFDLAEDTLKTLRALRKTIDKLFCAMTVANGAAAGVETEHCSAVPKVKMSVSLPTRSNNPEKFVELMTELGIPQDLQGNGDDKPEVVRLHYPGVTEWASDRLAEGRLLPGALGDPQKQFPVYSVRISKRKGVLE